MSRTLTELIDSFVEAISKEPENNSLKTDFWNCIISVGKLAKSNKDSLSPSQLSNAREFLEKSLEKVSKIFSDKQKQRVKEDLESIK